MYTPTASPSAPGTPPKSLDPIREIDIYSAIERVLFDLIGEIGIGHKFDATGNWAGEGGRMFHDYDRMQHMVPGSYGRRFDMSVLFPWTDKISVSTTGSQTGMR
jgi:hypothetical protein